MQAVPVLHAGRLCLQYHKFSTQALHYGTSGTQTKVQFGLNIVAVYLCMHAGTLCEHAGMHNSANVLVADIPGAARPQVAQATLK